MNDTIIPDSTWLAKMLDGSRMGGDAGRDHAGVDAVVAVWLSGDDQGTVNARVVRGRTLDPATPSLSISAESVTGEPAAIDLQAELGDPMDEGLSVPAPWRSFLTEAG